MPSPHLFHHHTKDMKLLKTLSFITLLLLIVSCGKDESDSQPSGIKKNDNKNSTSIYPEASRMEMPKLKGGQSILLVHKTNDTVEFEGETYPVVKVEISSSSHPFYTGKSKLVDTAGRVDKFMSRYGKAAKK